MQAKADIDVSAQAYIDSKYPVHANLQQEGVPILFDNLVGQFYSRVGKPIIDIIIANVNLEINSIDIIDFSSEQAPLIIQAQLSNFGPFDAIINFPKGIDIFFESSHAGIIVLPSITIPPEKTK
jgi:hypothetical protein